MEEGVGVPFDGLYRDIVESSADGIWVFDLDGRTLYANRALADMFGVSQEEFCRLTVFDTLDETGQGQFREHLADLRDGRFNTEDVDVQFVRGDGTAIWVLLGERPLYAEDGSLVGVLHRLADYSGRRQVVDALSASRRALDEAQRIARIGSWEWDVEADEIHGSEGLRALYGLADDAFPATYSDFMNIVHEDDRPEVHRVVQAARQAGGEFVFEARVRGADDELVWTRGRGLAIPDASGRVTRMSGTHQDISEAKAAEVALQDQVNQNTLMQTVASAANEAHTLAEVLVHARSMVLLHDDWERARGFMVEDGVVQPFYVSPEDKADDDATPEATAMEVALAQRCLDEGRSVWDESLLTIAFAIRYAGEAFAVITITSAPPLYRHEMIQAMVESVAVQLGRVVEREQHERALAAARDGAMEASRQKSEFLATMSHEIRTPLNGVIGLNDLLLRTRLDSDQQRLASGVQAASRSLLGLINDILDFSKIEAGKLQLERVDFEVREVFDQVINVIGEGARAKGLDLMIGCDPSVPGSLAGDPTRLAQVVTNLGSNAVKFTESGEVRISASAADADGRTVLRVEVSDTGIGIDPGDLGDLFDSFTQADASTTRVHGGTGLGLAISREIVHALGGEIGVDSVPGRGSVFWFTAAFDRAAGGADDEQARTSLGGRRALVVDENDHHRRVLADQLAWWGVRSLGVASADDAELALQGAMSEGDPFDVVLVDRTLALPRRNGLQLARGLRANPAYDDTTLLLLTATTDLDTARLRASGIADVLVKPVPSRSLRGSLLAHVAGVDTTTAADVASTASGRRRRILVVEDNPVNQMVAVGLLEAMGYDADTADDGQAGLDLYRAGSYDAVLMDVQMPRLDGYAATRAIRAGETDTHVPVLAMTAAAIEGERERCLAAGMDDFLTKPVDPDALAAALAHWLGGSAAGSPAPARGTVESSATYEGLDVERLDMLKEMGDGDTAYLDRAIGNFVANSPGQVDEIRSAVTAGDREAQRAAAHKLAGSALNLGVLGVGEAARAVEQAEGDATELVAALEASLAGGHRELLRYRSGDAGMTEAPAG